MADTGSCAFKDCGPVVTSPNLIASVKLHRGWPEYKAKYPALVAQQNLVEMHQGKHLPDTGGGVDEDQLGA